MADPRAQGLLSRLLEPGPEAPPQPLERASLAPWYRELQDESFDLSYNDRRRVARARTSGDDSSGDES